MATNVSTSGSDRTMAIEPAPYASVLLKVWRRRSLFAGVFCAVFGLALVALLVLPARYLASGSVIVAEPEPGVANASAAWAQKIGDPADLESQLLVIRSARVMRLAMQAPGAVEAVQRECRDGAAGLALLSLGRAVSCDKLQPDSDALIEYLQARYSVGSAGRSRVINIAYQSALPDVAQTLANALIKAFLDDQRKNIAGNREVAASWLWEELGRLDANLRDEEAKIQAFRKNKGLMRGATAPIAAERLTSIGQQLSTAEAARAEAAARLQEIKSDQARGSASAPSVLASRSIGDLKQQLATASAQLAAVSNQLGPNHPTLRALQEEVENLQQRYGREIASVVASAEKTYAAADALVASLNRKMEAAKAEVAAATTDETSIESMVRSVEIKRQQYAELYKRASELETERRLLIGSTRLVSLAEFPSKPFFPKRTPFMAGGLTFAVLLAFAAALLRDRSDKSVRAASELTLATGTPTFAQLPGLKPGNVISARKLLSGHHAELPLRAALRLAHSDPAVQNALRRLYANLVLAGGRQKLRTVLVTSPGAQEGKTFTTLALAQFVAATGRRVLVVECDLRCPTFESALEIDGSYGLADVLRGAIRPEEAVVSADVPNLDHIPAGHPTAESTELLMGRRMTDLLAWAQRYDLVLLDSPPSEAVMDARMLARNVDGVLCCVRWGHSPVTHAAATVETIREAGGKVFGVVVTMAKVEEQSLYEPQLAPGHAYLTAS